MGIFAIAFSCFREPNDATPFGSLTQRLISAFVEENIMLPPDGAATMIEPGKLRCKYYVAGISKNVKCLRKSMGS